MAARLLLFGLLAIGTAQAAAWWFDNFDRVTTQRFVGYSGRAAYDPFLAAQRLTAALGRDAHGRPGLSPSQWLPPATDTLFLADRHGTFFEQDFDALLDWVAAGGKLVVAPLPHSVDDAQDTLMDYLEIELVSTDSEVPVEACSEPCGRTAYDKLAAQLPTAQIDGYTITTGPHRPRLQYNNLELLASGSDVSGIFFLRFAVGKGLLTVVADTAFATNSLIGAHDNAVFLTTLLPASDGGNAVWFIYEDNYPGIPELLWRHAAVAVVAFGILLLLFLWRVGRRFGPPLPAPGQPRRSLLEHVNATGRLLWSTGNQSVLLGAIRGKLLHALERHHPGVSHSERDEQVRLLAEHTGQQPESIATLFQQDAPATPAELTHTVQALQRLWKKI